MSQTIQSAKLPTRLKLSYSTGDLSTSIPLAIVMFFQLYFLTDVAGLRPDLAGWAVAAQRREGSFYAFASFFQKLGTGAAIWTMGQVLALTGYLNPPPGGPLPVQPPEAVTALRIFVGPVPAVLLLLAIFLPGATRLRASSTAHCWTSWPAERGNFRCNAPMRSDSPRSGSRRAASCAPRTVWPS